MIRPSKPDDSYFGGCHTPPYPPQVSPLPTNKSLLIVTTYTGTDSSKRQIELNIEKKTFINAIGGGQCQVWKSSHTNCGYEVYRKQAYFIDTVAMRYAKNRHSTLLATYRGYEVCRKQVYFFPETKKKLQFH
jgi:hypothetical protein